MKLRMFLVLLVLSLAHKACLYSLYGNETSTSSPAEEEEDLTLTVDPLPFDDSVTKVAETSNYFALKLYREVAQQNGTSAFAPFSLFTVLSALYVGSENETSKELNRTLGYSLNNLSELEMLEGFRELATRLRNSGLRLANGLWTKEGVTLHPNFRREAEKWFMADVAPFSGGTEAQEAVNQWVSKVTEGHVPSLLSSPPNEAARILLLSALHFKGVWLTRFDPAHTFRGSFRRSINNTVQVSMMSVQGQFRYAHSPHLGAKVIEMPFTGEEVSMLVILPDSSLPEVENRLSADALFHAVDGMRDRSVLVTLPKFELQGSLNLREALQTLGIQRAFGSGAQLGKMTAGDDDDFFVSEVRHRAVVEVDEEGAQASGVSGVSITSKRGSRFETFYADRPFMFFIGHIPSGLILFMGRVEDFV